MSRLGRNYLEVGRLMEEFFPENDIRLVAVSDGIDTAEGENQLTPIRNLFNEWYARDISKKRRISNKIRGNAGEPLGRPPYGYQVDPNNSKRWTVDPVAAAVVRQIYEWTLDGFGPSQIAGKLMDDDVLNPTAYWQSIGVKRSGKKRNRISNQVGKRNRDQNTDSPGILRRCYQLQDLQQVLQVEKTHRKR